MNKTKNSTPAISPCGGRLSAWRCLSGRRPRLAHTPASSREETRLRPPLSVDVSLLHARRRGRTCSRYHEGEPSMQDPTPPSINSGLEQELFYEYHHDSR